MPMIGPRSPADERSEQESEGISLWNFQRDLLRLADELSEAPAEVKHDYRDGEPSHPAAPRLYFEALLAQRRKRKLAFANDRLNHPAWDIMLRLMIARIDGRDMRVSEVLANHDSGHTMAREDIDSLLKAMLIERYDCTSGSADCLLALSSEAARRMAELYRARMRG